MRRFSEESADKLVQNLLKPQELLSDIEKGDFVGVKIHVGEKGNITHLRPEIVRVVVDLIEERGGKPFLFDCNTLYRIKRWNAVDHHITANRNGFGFGNIGAPFIIGDGLIGKDEVTIETDFEHVPEVHAGKIIEDMDYLFVISHFKFHDLFGYGGAIKNVGMGMASRRGKLYLHSDVKPDVVEEKCILCGDCAVNCPVNAINLKDYAIINAEVCIGCGMCVVSCKEGAIKFNWKFDTEASIKTVYYTKAILDKIPKKTYMNVLMDITPHCDCFSATMNPVVENIGIMASRDIVSIDSASKEFVEQAKPLNGVKWKREDLKDKDKVRALFDGPSNVDECLELAEEIGLGSKDFNIIELE